MASCRVDFYVPSSDMPDERYTLACRVTEKAFQSGKQVYLYCQTPDQLTQMDERLWTFSLNSFIPHGLLGETDELVRVILGCDDPSPDVAEIVISMANTPVSTFNLFWINIQLCQTISSFEQKSSAASQIVDTGISESLIRS